MTEMNSNQNIFQLSRVMRLILICLFIATVTSSRTLFADSNDIPDVTSIINDFKPCLRTTPRMYRFYHYTTVAYVERIKPKEMTLPDAIRDHARLWSDFYWEPNRERGVKAGLYTSVDPISSYSVFGGSEDFLLYRIQIPAGTVYYDMSNYCPLSKNSQKLLTNADCSFEDESPGHLFEPGSGTPSCQKLLRPIFDTLKIRGWSGGFSSVKFPGCQGWPNRMFIWLDLSKLPKNSVAIFTATPPASGTPSFEEAVEIEQMWRADFYKSLWDSLIIEADRGVKPLNQVLGESLMGCENLWPAR